MVFQRYHATVLSVPFPLSPTASAILFLRVAATGVHGGLLPSTPEGTNTSAAHFTYFSIHPTEEYVSASLGARIPRI